MNKLRQTKTLNRLEGDNMVDLSCCGTECSSCGCYGSMCKGCNESKGKVFHCPEGQECAIYECCITKHKYNDCSECKEVPCHIWRKTRDPKYTDQEFEENVKQRVNNLLGQA